LQRAEYEIGPTGIAAMTDTIFDAKDLPAPATPGDGNGRFQVMLRLEKGLPQQAIDALTRLLGGRLEKAIIERGWQLEVDKGNVIVLSFPDTPARASIIAALSRRPGVEVAELDAPVRAQLVSTDTHYGNGNLWGMYGPSGDGIGAFSNAFGTHADVAWARSDISADGKVGSMRTVVGVIDSGVDPLHPDLYLNIWINQKEIPAGLATDQDSDGVITFRDLNVQVSGNYVNAVSDVNGNGRIDADDILQLPAWANGADNDANGYTDDLFGWDFRNNDNRPFESYDNTGTNGNPADSYHGSHVAGTIGALANGAGVAGVVWDVQILPMRFLGSDGTGNTSDAISAIYYYTALGLANPTLEFVGTNNSWGGGGASSLLADAIQTAGNNGHLFFAAAGNDGTNNDSLPHYPSNYAISSTFQGVAYDPVISVASITSTGARSGFSNFGVSSVDIGAPGSTIASTLAGNEWFASYTYVNLSGTSMATPHVTGAAALIASEFPGLHPADLKAAILNGGVATASLAGITVTGDRLNIPGAIDLIGPSPVITSVNPVLNLEDTSEIFTITFSEAVSGFTLSDVSVTSGHGTLSDLTTTDNIVWTVRLTLPVVETNAARILVGNRYTTALGDFGREGQSAAFTIDRIAPTVTVPTITATRDAAGANVDGTLSATLGSGDVVNVFRGGTLLGNASVTGTNWHFDDTGTLADGTYQYTARVADAATNNGPLSGNGTLVISTFMPAPTVIVSDALLNLADAMAGVTITFSEAVTGFDIGDLTATPGHGSISNLTTTNNIVWTATFTPAVVETQAAKIMVGTGYTSQVGGKTATAGESALFAIDRVAPTVTISTIAATRDGTGANVDGTLSAALGSGDVLKVYRDSALLGDATVTSTSWHYDDLTALANGTYQYTARPFDAAGNQGTQSNQASLLVATYLPAPTVTVSDTSLRLADPNPIVTVTFLEAVTGFDIGDLSVTPGHGSISNLTTTNNIVWTATFTPAVVETQAAKIQVGSGYTSSAGGLPGTAGESAAFTIDRIAPTAKVLTIAATRDGTGANVDGTLSAALGPGEVLKVYRGSTALGNATLTGTSWHYDDTAALADGTYQYRARVIDAVANVGAYSSLAPLVVLSPPMSASSSTEFDPSLALGVSSLSALGTLPLLLSGNDGMVAGPFAATGLSVMPTSPSWVESTATDLEVRLAETQSSYLAISPPGSSGTSEIIVPADQQLGATNILTLVAQNPVDTWAIGTIHIDTIV